MYCYIFGQTGLSKQYKPRSDAEECSVSSGSTLFATHPAALDTSSGSKKDLLRFWDKHVKKSMCPNN